MAIWGKETERERGRATQLKDDASKVHFLIFPVKLIAQSGQSVKGGERGRGERERSLGGRG